MPTSAIGSRVMREPQRSSCAVWVGVMALAAALLLAPAIWNGFPLLQYDTGGYLARWFEGYLVPSRPGAYGLLLAATAFSHFWLALVVQAALTLWVLTLVLRTHGFGGRPLLLLAIVAALTAFTTLPWLTSILLTDIFAGLAVLALHLLVFRREQLGRWTRHGLLLLTAFAGATHGATMVLLLALACVAALAHFRWPQHVTAGGLGWASAAAVLAFVLTLAGNFAVSGRVAWTPGGSSILFGRMLQDGIVHRYLEDHCPDPGLKLCPYRRELPRDADAFLWSNSVFNSLGRFSGLGDEMSRIVRRSLRAYPGMQITTAVRATAAQLLRVASGEGVLPSVWHTYGIMERYTPSVVPAMKAARQQRGELDFAVINMIHVPIGLLALALLPLLVWLGRTRAALAEVGQLAATLLVTLLLNAAICGAISNPHNRYGARLIWLAPLTALLAPLRLRQGQPVAVPATVPGGHALAPPRPAEEPAAGRPNAC